jgi:hypothetical protein
MENLFKPQIIKSFTHQVKNFLCGSQLQVFRSWRSASGAWLYEFRFFPGPKKGILLGFEPQNGDWAFGFMESSEDLAYAKEGLEAAQDPVQLYARAHAVNRRVEAVRSFEASDERGEGWELELSGGVSWIWERVKPRGSEVRVRILRKGAKEFARHFELGSLKPSSGGEGVGPSLLEKQRVHQAVSRLRSKEEKLIEKVQGDLDSSRRGLDELQALCAFLEADPMAWGRDSDWPEEAQRALLWVRDTAQLPGFQGSTRGAALELIYELRRRYRRKLQGAQKRLAEVEAKQAEAATLRASGGGLAVSTRPSQPSKKKTTTPRSLGLWVQHASALRARLGRSQTENAQLYREAASRDLWFHVRGLGGSHVWVPRGQPLFTGKDPALKDELELWACQLAVYNSKARHAGYGVVDITEKRHLRAAKGQEGTLLIQRSQTRMVEIDEAFMNWIAQF